jgi:hypothetical protein
MYIIRRFIVCVPWGDKIEVSEMDEGCGMDE